jgi:hypothetical protein
LGVGFLNIYKIAAATGLRNGLVAVGGAAIYSDLFLVSKWFAYKMSPLLLSATVLFFLPNSLGGVRGGGYWPDSLPVK